MVGRKNSPIRGRDLQQNQVEERAADDITNYEKKKTQVNDL